MVKPWLCFVLQVGSSDIDNVNIIAFRQINQFDLSGNVITASEYLSTLCVSSSLSSPPSVLARGFLQGRWQLFSGQGRDVIQVMTSISMEVNVDTR